MMGVYTIKNIINNKIYVGSSINISRRFSTHTYELKNNRHRNKHLQSAWNKYGEENFKFEILECVLNSIVLIEREQHWMDTFQSYNNEKGYNNRPRADSPLGYKHSEETKLKLSALRKGKLLSEETKKKISEKSSGENNGFYGRKHTDETRKKFSKRKLSKEHKEILSKLRRGSGAPTAKLTESQVKTIKEKIHIGIPEKSIAEEYEVSTQIISRIRSGETWSFVETDFTFEYFKKKSHFIENSQKGENNCSSKLKEVDVIEIKKMIRNGYTNKKIGEKFNVHPSNISSIKRGKSWTHVI